MLLLLYKALLRQLLRPCKCLAAHPLASRVVNFDFWCLQAGLMTKIRVCILRYNNLASLLRSRVRKVICYEDYMKVQSEDLPNTNGHVYFCNLVAVVRYLQMLYQRNFSKALWETMPCFRGVFLWIFFTLFQNTMPRFFKTWNNWKYMWDVAFFWNETKYLNLNLKQEDVCFLKHPNLLSSLLYWKLH